MNHMNRIKMQRSYADLSGRTPTGRVSDSSVSPAPCNHGYPMPRPSPRSSAHGLSTLELSVIPRAAPATAAAGLRCMLACAVAERRTAPSTHHTCSLPDRLRHAMPRWAALHHRCCSPLHLPFVVQRKYNACSPILRVSLAPPCQGDGGGGGAYSIARRRSSTGCDTPLAVRSARSPARWAPCPFIASLLGPFTSAALARRTSRWTCGWTGSRLAPRPQRAAMAREGCRRR